jgi:hypothetical protein
MLYNQLSFVDLSQGTLCTHPLAISLARMSPQGEATIPEPTEYFATLDRYQRW